MIKSLPSKLDEQTIAYLLRNGFHRVLFDNPVYKEDLFDFLTKNTGKLTEEDVGFIHLLFNCANSVPSLTSAEIKTLLTISGVSISDHFLLNNLIYLIKHDEFMYWKKAVQNIPDFNSALCEAIIYDRSTLRKVSSDVESSIYNLFKNQFHESKGFFIDLIANHFDFLFFQSRNKFHAMDNHKLFIEKLFDKNKNNFDVLITDFK